MRLSVLFSDLIFYIPFCYLFVFICKKSNKQIMNYWHYFILILCPAVLLIDHGHFQVFFVNVYSIMQFHLV